MRKIIILLLCCGMIASIVGCGGNTAPLPKENPPTMVAETIITETPHITATEPPEKEKEPVATESAVLTTVPTTTVPTTTTESIEETKPIETTKTTVRNTSEEKVAPQVEETAPSTTPQNEEQKAESVQETVSEHDASPPEFDIHYWITFAKEYAVSVGLTLDSEAVSCWDNPIGAGAHCIYLERDIKSRLNRYVKDEDITDVWIWVESIGDDCYNIYIGYA